MNLLLCEHTLRRLEARLRAHGAHNSPRHGARQIHTQQDKNIGFIVIVLLRTLQKARRRVRTWTAQALPASAWHGNLAPKQREGFVCPDRSQWPKNAPKQQSSALVQFETLKTRMSTKKHPWLIQRDRLSSTTVKHSSGCKTASLHLPSNFGCYLAKLSARCSLSS